METNQLVRLHAIAHPFTEAPPVPTAHQLDRLPVWCQSRHVLPLGAHLDGLAQLHAEPVSPTNLVARFDRLSRPSPTARPVPSLHR